MNNTSRAFVHILELLGVELLSDGICMCLALVDNSIQFSNVCINLEFYYTISI